MKSTIHKVFFIWDFEKEEKWLNEMSAKGLQLHSVGFCTYVFDEGAPGEYTYRMEMLKNRPGNADSVKYIKFVEETGAEHIGSLLKWVYFRKKSDQKGFDLYSDIDSRVAHLNRILSLVCVIMVALLLNSLNQFRMWLDTGIGLSLFTAVFSMAFGIFCCYGFARLNIKKQKLKREKVLHE
jgi:ABC-type maltose transport system permease subunit